MSKDKIIELSNQGKSVTDIANALNVSKAHVSQTLKRYRDRTPPQEPESSLPSVPEPETKILDELPGQADRAKDAELPESEESRIVEPIASGTGTRHQKSMQTHSYKQNKNLFYQKKLVIKAMVETLFAQGATKDEIQDILNQY